MIWDFLHFYVIFLLWATATSDLETKPFFVNKCCPEGEVLDRYFDCIPIEPSQYDDFSNKSVEDFSWFPIDAIVNSTTLKIHEHHSGNYLEILKQEYRINQGVKPDCFDQREWDFSYFLKNRSEEFHFILLENNSIIIHISKASSFHDLEDVEFERINETTEVNDVIDLNIKNGTTLRTFPMEHACVDMGTQKAYLMLICPCMSTLCIRKCCKHDEIMTVTEVGEKGEPSCLKISDIPKEISNPIWRPLESLKNQYYLLTSTFPNCSSDRAAVLLKMWPNDVCANYDSDFHNNFTIFSNGSIKVNKYDNFYPSDQFCGDVTWHEGDVIYEQNLIICSGINDSEKERLKRIKFLVYGVLLIIGGVCLLITVAVSLLLPELRRRIHNKIALSHNASLMVAYFAWGITQLWEKLDGKSCLVLSLVIQFTFLASFFWLNVMCIDISTTFSGTRSLGGISHGSSNKKFILYCLYSWGSASIITIITLIMEFVDVPYPILKPGISCMCGFNARTSSILVYFYGPMAVLLLFNMVLFIFTTFKIMTIQRQTTAILHKTESNATGGVSFQTDKQRYDLYQWLILYAKLFLLMGLTWVTEILSWAIGGPDYYWYFTDTVNLLRAVFIFILFICKRPILLSLRRKLTGESFSFSNKTGSSKSTTDVLSITTSGRDSRFRSSTSSSKRRDTCGKIEMEVQKNTLPRQIEI